MNISITKMFLHLNMLNSVSEDEGLIKVWVSPEKVIKPTGSRVVLLCEVDYDNEFTVEWTFYGQALPNNSRVVYDMELVIENVSVSNSGEYMCLVKHDMNSNSAVGRVEVYWG